MQLTLPKNPVFSVIAPAKTRDYKAFKNGDKELPAGKSLIATAVVMDSNKVNQVVRIKIKNPTEEMEFKEAEYILPEVISFYQKGFYFETRVEFNELAQK